MSSRSRWTQRPAAPPQFMQALPRYVSPLIGQLLWNRSITDPALVDDFLSPSMAHLHHPSSLRHMDEAVERIKQACASGEKVAVYGDYDADGVTGVALLYQVLSSIGLAVKPYIPHRFNEGYGLNIAAIDELAGNASLLITVDCGISNYEEIRHARSLGMDVIVLDHHQPPPQLPPGNAVINAKQQACTYPFKELCGVGVAYKLVQALHRAGLRTPFRGRDLLDVVALGTVSDMVPLHGENRVLVKYGLEALNSCQRPGLQALIDVAGIRGGINARTIGFTLGPRLNAAGRLTNAVQAYELLLCGDHVEAHRLAAALDELNVRRQHMTRNVQQAATEMVVERGQEDRRILLLDSVDFPAGVVGLVAGRLVDVFSRPVLLLERGAEISHGSARSVTGFSLVEALAECADLFEKFGGHAMAAGFTIKTARLPELETRLEAIGVRCLTDEMLSSRLEYDAEIPLGVVSLDLIDQVSQLEPFGFGNPEPLYVTRNVRRAAAPEATGPRWTRHSGRGRVVGTRGSTCRVPWSLCGSRLFGRCQ
ncbi:MAG: single-stranded-DNA-specific exonuclease RecJ [Herpetosiphon sp.]